MKLVLCKPAVLTTDKTAFSLFSYQTGLLKSFFYESGETETALVDYCEETCSATGAFLDTLLGFAMQLGKWDKVEL